MALRLVRAHGKRVSCRSDFSNNTTTPTPAERILLSTHTRPRWRRKNTFGKIAPHAPRPERAVAQKEREARRATSVREPEPDLDASENGESARDSRETLWHIRSSADEPEQSESAMPRPVWVDLRRGRQSRRLSPEWTANGLSG